jgi:hypothetical protein
MGTLKDEPSQVTQRPGPPEPSFGRTDDRRQLFQVGDRVSKLGGDYRFEGIVRMAGTKASGVWRYAVEDDRGVLFIFGAHQLTLLRLAHDPKEGEST